MIMKKLLLMLVALTATVTISADAEKGEWKRQYPVWLEENRPSGIHSAIAADGSAYVSTMYDVQFSFAEKDVAEPIGKSSCIMKFDKDGNELWAVALQGACRINAMTVDADGTLYAAGYSEDVAVNCIGTDSQVKQIINPSEDNVATAYSAFIVKVSNAGIVEAVATLTPETNAEIAASVEPMYVNFSYEPLDVTPRNIVIAGDKVVLAAAYYGDVKCGETALWEGAYTFAWEVYYVDNRSYGIASFNKSDLSGVANMAYVQMANNKTGDLAHCPEGLNILSDGTKVFAAFFGWGSLDIIKDASTKKTVEFSVIPAATEFESATREHGLVLVDLSDIANPIVFHAEGNTIEYPNYNICGGIKDDTYIYLGGSYNGVCPLDNTKAATETNSATFVACVQNSDASVQWVANDTDGKHSNSRAIAKQGENILFATIYNLHEINAADGSITKSTAGEIDDISANDNYQVRAIAAISAVEVNYITKVADGISTVKAQNTGAAQFFNLNGQRVAAPQKGLYIVNGNKVVIK